MKIELESKYNIGDKIKVYHYIFKQGFVIETLEVSHLRFCFDGCDWKVQYFFKGLTSYEGENWFDETDKASDIACCGGIVEDSETRSQLLEYLAELKSELNKFDD